MDKPEKGVDLFNAMDETSKRIYADAFVRNARYKPPAYHVLTVGIALALSILVVGMAAILVLHTAGLLPG